MVNNKNKFELASKRERIAFIQILDKFKKNYEKKGQKMYYFLTDVSSKETYDVLMHIYDLNGNKVESNIIEIKVRNKHFDDLILEKNKYNNLIKNRKKQLKYFNKVNILYLNFTTCGTYLFDLSDKKFIWENSFYNKYTVLSNEKIEKEVTKLNIESCINLNYVFDYDLYNYEKVNEKLNEQKSYKCIFKTIEK